MSQTPRECSESRERTKTRLGVWRFLICCLFVLVSAPACTVLRAPQKVVSAVVPTRSQPDPVELQLEVQRFVDAFHVQTARALDEYARCADTPAARVDALQFKLMSVSGAINIASSPNPFLGLLDLVSVVSIRRRVIEDYWMKTTNGGCFAQWRDICQVQETNVWQLAARFLKPAQLEELRNYLEQWYAANRDTVTTSFIRPEGLSSIIKQTRQQKGNPDSLFNLIGLDPTAGLDPAIREVTRTRLFAERAMFTLQHAPFLLRWQTELLAYQLTSQPAIQLALTNTSQISESLSRVSRASESFSQTVALLPDRVSAERQAILTSLDQQAGKLRELAAEVDRVLAAGQGMSTSLNTTITSFDGLMKRFGVGEPPANTSSVPDTNSPPFNILDYGEVASKIATMATDVNTLVGSVNSSVPQLERLTQQATVDLQQVVDRTFKLGLILIGVLLGGALTAALIYRAVVFTWTRNSRKGADVVQDREG